MAGKGETMGSLDLGVLSSLAFKTQRANATRVEIKTK